MPRTREKRSFATIRKLPSGRFQVRYTGPDGGTPHRALRRSAPAIDAEAFVVAKRREIDRGVWDADRRRRSGDSDHVRRVRRRMGGRPTGRRPPDQGPHPRALLARSSKTTWSRVRRPPDRRHHAEGVRDWHAGALVDRPTMR